MELLHAFFNGQSLQFSGHGCEFVRCDFRRTALVEKGASNIADGFDAASRSDTHFNFLSAKLLLQSAVCHFDVSAHQLVESVSAQTPLMKNPQQADTPHRITLRRNDSAFVAEADLHAAAADIDEKSYFAVQMDTLFDGQMDEPGLFLRADDGDR